MNFIKTKSFFEKHKKTQSLIIAVVIISVTITLLFGALNLKEYVSANKVVKQCDTTDIASLYNTCKYLLNTDCYNLIIETYPLLFEHKDFASYINNTDSQNDDIHQAMDYLYIKYFFSCFFEQSEEAFLNNLETYFDRLSLDKTEYGYNAATTFNVRLKQQWGVFISIRDVYEINQFMACFESFIVGTPDNYVHKALGYNILSKTYGQLGFLSKAVVYNQKIAIAEYRYNVTTVEAQK